MPNAPEDTTIPAISMPDAPTRLGEGRPSAGPEHREGSSLGSPENLLSDHPDNAVFEDPPNLEAFSRGQREGMRQPRDAPWASYRNRSETRGREARFQELLQPTVVPRLVAPQ